LNCFGKEVSKIIKLYTQEVTHCLNCPNIFSTHKTTKIGKYISEYRCKAVGDRTWKFIHMKTDEEETYFPEWCPLLNIGEETHCNCNTRMEND